LLQVRFHPSPWGGCVSIWQEQRIFSAEFTQAVPRGAVVEVALSGLLQAQRRWFKGFGERHYQSGKRRQKKIKSA